MQAQDLCESIDSHQLMRLITRHSNTAARTAVGLYVDMFVNAAANCAPRLSMCDMTHSHV